MATPQMHGHVFSVLAPSNSLGVVLIWDNIVQTMTSVGWVINLKGFVGPAQHVIFLGAIWDGVQ